MVNLVWCFSWGLFHSDHASIWDAYCILQLPPSCIRPHFLCASSLAWATQASFTKYKYKHKFESKIRYKYKSYLRHQFLGASSRFQIRIQIQTQLFMRIQPVVCNTSNITNSKVISSIHETVKIYLSWLQAVFVKISESFCRSWATQVTLQTQKFSHQDRRLSKYICPSCKLYLNI